MINKRKFSSFIPLFTTLLLTSSCGGSSSSSGGSTIIYVGVQKISIAQFRVVSAPRITTFRLDRNGDQITVVDKNFQATATLVGESFVVTSPDIEISLNGTTCSYSISYTGTVTQSAVSGTLNGPLNCPFIGALSGEFEATAQSGSSSTILPSVSDLITGN